jgi:citrate synthase
MPEFSPGLEGVLAAKTEISMVDGQNGRLVYRGGYTIADLYENCTFEEVAHLLWFGELPTEEELDDTKRRLAARRALNEPARKALAALPSDTDPMDVLRTVVSAQGAAKELQKPDIDQAISMTAVMATGLAAAYRHSRGEEPIEPRDDLGHAANCLYMAFGDVDEQRAKYLDSYFVLLADHGMNASTFTARVVASTNSDLCSAVVAAIGALKGPAHGAAALEAMNMLEKIGSPDNVEPWMRSALDRKEKLFGFGHRIYRTDDPRAKILRPLSEQANPEFYAIASRGEEVALRLLHERHPERPQATNVDYYSAGLLAAAGLPKQFFTLAFAASRVAGWTAHVLEQVKVNRIIRPDSEYVGPEPHPVRPLRERAKAATG